MDTIVVHVLGYRAFDYLKNQSLDQILSASKQVENYDVRIVFQDNYSQDGSVEIACGTPMVDVLLSRENLMYTGGVNSGLQYIEKMYHPKYVILVDADNYCELSAYRKLVDFMDNNHQVGIAQPLVVSKKDPSRVYSCGHLYEDGVFCKPRRVLPRSKADLLNMESCSICSTIVRMDIIRRIGLLNEVFRMYYESSDWCFRIRKEGYLCACCPESLCYNEGTMVTPTGNYHEAYYRLRNGLVFWYMHDQEKFQIMKNSLIDQLVTLNDEFNKNDFCVDCVKESARKGIEDGLQCCNRNQPEQLKAMAPSLFDFDKSKIIVLKHE